MPAKSSSAADQDAKKGAVVVRTGRRGDGRDRQIVGADQSDHRRHRRDRVPDQLARPERGRRSRARRRCGSRLRRRRFGSSRTRPTLGGRGQGDQGSDLDLDHASRSRRQAGRGNRQVARAHHRAGDGDQRPSSPKSRRERRNRRPHCKRSTPRSIRWTRRRSRMRRWSRNRPRRAIRFRARPRNCRAWSIGFKSAMAAGCAENCKRSRHTRSQRRRAGLPRPPDARLA